MTSKLKSMKIFMTDSDEILFTNLLKEQRPQIKFIEYFVWNTPNPPVYDSLAECCNNKSSYVIIIDTSIVSVDEYKEKRIFPHPAGEGYLGSQVGEGLIQFLHSREGSYVSNCLGNGTLAASYNSEYQPETDIFVKTVWKTIKKNALKVYALDKEKGSIADKPEGFYAFPDAATKYNGTHDKYLTSSALHFCIAR